MLNEDQADKEWPGTENRETEGGCLILKVLLGAGVKRRRGTKFAELKK